MRRIWGKLRMKVDRLARGNGDRKELNDAKSNPTEGRR